MGMVEWANSSENSAEDRVETKKVFCNSQLSSTCLLMSSSAGKTWLTAAKKVCEKEYINKWEKQERERVKAILLNQKPLQMFETIVGDGENRFKPKTQKPWVRRCSFFQTLLGCWCLFKSLSNMTQSFPQSFKQQAAGALNNERHIKAWWIIWREGETGWGIG